MKEKSINLHSIQLNILERLSKSNTLKFNDLVIKGIATDHMNYHLKKLVSYKFVKKGSKGYSLSNEGKDYINLLDDDVKLIEKQPKTSVLLHIVRKNHNGEVENLVCKRLKQPYLGKVGRLTGKVRFGESIIDAGKRELYEETGLIASTLILEGIYRKRRYDDVKNPVQDVIFYRLFSISPSGTLIKKTSFQENYWVTTKDFKEKKHDFYDDVEISNRFTPKRFTFQESSGVMSGF